MFVLRGKFGLRSLEGEQIMERQLRRGDGPEALGEMKIVYHSSLSLAHIMEEKKLDHLPSPV
jgi:hypothetical protein